MREIAAIEIVAALAEEHLQPRRILRRELQPRRLEIDDQVRRTDHGDRDEHRVAGGDRAPVRPQVERLTAHAELQHLRRIALARPRAIPDVGARVPPLHGVEARGRRREQRRRRQDGEQPQPARGPLLGGSGGRRVTRRDRRRHRYRQRQPEGGAV
jgi:hypothetical protein